MAGVTAQEEAAVYAAATPQWGAATRKYAADFIGTLFLVPAQIPARLPSALPEPAQ